MTATPVFVQTPKIGMANISAANTARDGSGTVGTAFTAGSSGSRVDKIVAKAKVTTTAGMIRVFLYDGATYRLLKEYEVAAITPSATVKTWEVEDTLTGGLALPTGYSLRFSTHNAESFDVGAEGWDY